ncbi:MAG: hypothetical protein QXY79_04470 [Candidatus Methanomethylicia archaeon]
MNNFEFKKQIEEVSKKSLEKDYVDYSILVIYLKKWIDKRKIINSNQKIIDLIKIIEKNKKDLEQKIKSKQNKTRYENFLKEINFLEKKIFIFLEKNNITLDNNILELIETAKQKIIELKNIIEKNE